MSEDERFKDWDKDLKNCTDIVGLTNPEAIVRDSPRIPRGRVRTSSRRTRSMPVRLAWRILDFPNEIVREINLAAVTNARKAADEFTRKTPDRPRFVAGSMGPTSQQTAISTKVDDPAYRGITFEEMEASYYQQAAALVEGGVDILFPETVIDTLNLKACLFAIARYFEESGNRVPVMVSGTFAESGVDFCFGPGRRSLLEQHLAFPDDQCRDELRLRARRHASAYRRAVQNRNSLYQLPSQCRNSQRDGAV